MGLAHDLNLRRRDGLANRFFGRAALGWEEHGNAAPFGRAVVVDQVGRDAREHGPAFLGVQYSARREEKPQTSEQGLVLRGELQQAPQDRRHHESDGCALAFRRCDEVLGLEGWRKEDHGRALEQGLDPGLPIVLVIGGSQGARVLNDVVPSSLGRLGYRLQVFHLAGAGRDREVRSHYNEFSRITALVRPVVMDMATLYAAADLVICRGGGGTVSELMAAGRAAIIVPYPHHRDRQQWHNGRVLAKAGAAIVRDESEVDVDELSRCVVDLLPNRERLAEMGRRARGLAPVDSCARIIEDMQAQGALD